MATSSGSENQGERERVLAAELTRRQELLKEANRWAESKQIRSYVEHIRASAAAHPKTLTELNSCTDWALRVAADLDQTGKRLALQSEESTSIDLE